MLIRETHIRIMYDQSMIDAYYNRADYDAEIALHDNQYRTQRLGLISV